jgi:hypothetical protein
MSIILLFPKRKAESKHCNTVVHHVGSTLAGVSVTPKWCPRTKFGTKACPSIHSNFLIVFTARLAIWATSVASTTSHHRPLWCSWKTSTLPRRPAGILASVLPLSIVPRRLIRRIPRPALSGVRLLAYMETRELFVQSSQSPCLPVPLVPLFVWYASISIYQSLILSR